MQRATDVKSVMVKTQNDVFDDGSTSQTYINLHLLLTSAKGRKVSYTCHKLHAAEYFTRH